MFQNIVNPFPSTASRRDLDYCNCLNSSIVPDLLHTRKSLLTEPKAGANPLLLR